MAKLFQIRSFITYWLDAVSEHSLHSPFFYDFYTKVVKHTATELMHGQGAIESLRQQYRGDNRTITINDFGAGSMTLKSSTRRIDSIAATALAPPAYAQLFVRIARMAGATDMIELGTCLGLTTLYLASLPGATVTTFEGASAIADLARHSFAQAGASNITLVQGNIDQTLPRHLHQVKKVDFALLDANHRYEPTVRYFEWIAQKTHSATVIVVDDIHLSSDMERAWERLRHHDLVYGSADLYRCGVLFFDPSLNKQHVVLQG